MKASSQTAKLYLLFAMYVRLWAESKMFLFSILSITDIEQRYNSYFKNKLTPAREIVKQIIYVHTNLMKRDSFVRQAIDPNGTLPEVAFLHDISVIGLNGYRIMHQDTEAGRASIKQCESKPERYFSSIVIEPLGRGLGLASYILAIEMAHDEGNAFRNDPDVLSRRAAAVWQKFIEAGVAEVVQPITPVVYDRGDAVAVNYTGYVRISPR